MPNHNRSKSESDRPYRVAVATGYDLRGNFTHEMVIKRFYSRNDYLASIGREPETPDHYVYRSFDTPE